MKINNKQRTDIRGRIFSLPLFISAILYFGFRQDHSRDKQKRQMYSTSKRANLFTLGHVKISSTIDITLAMMK